MTDLCRECYYWIERPSGDDGCRLLIDRPEIGVCVARLTARVRELEEREAKPSLTPGLERAKELLNDIAEEWEASAVEYLDQANDLPSGGPEWRACLGSALLSAARRDELFSAASAIAETAAPGGAK